MTNSTRDNVPFDTDLQADPLYQKAVDIVMETRCASISWIQRRLKLGYMRANAIVAQMERSGVVGLPDGEGNRDVLL